MNMRSAADIGLIPPVLLDRIRLVGNAAGAGARIALISKSNRAVAEQIARRVRYIELTVHPQFKRHFAHALRFPD